MIKLILIRHGESEANSKKVFAGNFDVDLTARGYAQAATTAEYIEAHYEVDEVYASDLLRAFHTGEALATRIGKTVIPDKGLREIFAGEWEGKAFDDLDAYYAETYAVWRTDIGSAAPNGGESVAELQKRVVTALSRIAVKNEGKTVAVATHATPIRSLLCYAKRLPLSEMKNIPWVSNASFSVFCYEDGVFTPETVGYDAHLLGEKTQFPSNV